MYSSILSKNGYGILKSELNEYALESIRKDLTMTPKVNFDIGKSKNNNSNEEEVSFNLYSENEKRIYIPRYYGLQKYGLPTLCKLTSGKDINIEFVGNIRETQQEPIENFLKGQKDVKVKTVGTDLEVNLDDVKVQVMFRKDYVSVKKSGEKVEEFKYTELGKIKSEIKKHLK